ncbi:ABC transporter substrate-binding protein [Pararhizobium mangrovi]|uniref:ABC transporter substrate-binding protein n=1 Tax=Pararhizobium mangrovi TaxID=2590452 RepID=A0A506U9T0_9HYPH|nr:ABC transporter substrate-binding protein [Pararhizobium mangrovi]TPW30288.1 ABC transporter substrate-binding protein [Pararhizobium mangrovi]
MKNSAFLLAAATTAFALSTSLATAQSSSTNSMDKLVAAAKKEGELTVIALPHDWCNWAGMIEGFKKKYGIKVNELNPNAGSGDELQAIKANKGNNGQQAPDVIDVGLSFGQTAAKQGLLMPYKVSNWDQIPDELKDENGHWYGDYYGVLAIGANEDLVSDAPESFEDLLDSQYGNAVALPGDPRTGNSAIMSIYAAGVSRGAKSGKEAAQDGLQFFKKLGDNGNFVPVVGSASTFAQGTTPVLLNWDFLLLSMRDTLQGNPPVKISVPEKGVVAGAYVQAISAYAPHPNAAKLWEEYLYSDEGGINWLKGYCHPVRFNEMVKAGAVPKEILDKMPPAKAYEKAVFPSLSDQGDAQSIISQQWSKTMGATVK